MLEKLLTLPGFIYEADGAYYYLGKWICKECTNVDETDCVTMYQMCRAGGEERKHPSIFRKSGLTVISLWTFPTIRH